jgi:hypothetical protein
MKNTKIKKTEMNVKLNNGDVIAAYKDVSGTYAAKWQIGQKTGSCYQKNDEVTEEVSEEDV